MDSEVTQSPGHLVKGKDQKAKMDCVPIKGHTSVYWYLKKLESFEFLVYLRNGKITEDTAMFKQRFSAECPQNSPCSLEINSTEAADSALYFCASSQSTVLHVSSS
uniref:Immunoglobulin V-set domain-containing protein n=1 Tax=Bos taurus TaxID=9913 RepID=A0ABI0P195_BOVIN